MFGFLKAIFDRQAKGAIDKRARQTVAGKAKPGAAKTGTPSKAAPPKKNGVKPVPAKKIAPAKTAPQDTERQKAIASMQSQMKNVMTPERAELIRNALAVHKAKQSILADLNDEARAKLVALAITSLLNEGKDEPAPAPKKK